MAAHLLFERPAPAGTDQERAHLIFGDDASGPPVVGDDVLATPAGVFPPLAGYVSGSIPEDATATPFGVFPPLEGSIGAEYNSGVSRPLAHVVRGQAQQAMPVRMALHAGFRRSAPTGLHVVSAAQQAQAIGARWIGRMGGTQSHAGWWNVLAQQAQPLRSRWDIWFETSRHLEHRVIGRWQSAQPVRVRWSLAFQTAIWLRHLLDSRYQQAMPLRLWFADGAQSALPLSALCGGVWMGVRYQQAMPVPPRARRPDDSGGGAPPGPVCYTPSAHLVFCRRPDGTADLLFECHSDCDNTAGTTVIVPVQRVYIVENNITLIRLEGGIDLHPLEFSLSLDADSWTWSWSATLHHAMGAHLGRQANGEVPIVEAVINGQAVRLRLEQKSLDERFLPARWKVGGRGLNAVLAEPHAPALNFSPSTQLTAQQMAHQLLSLNGVGIGWDLDWQIDDWVIPAGAWTHHGTWMEGINDLTKAVGAYVQPHATEDILRILPRYPAMPWEWAGIAPHYDLPAGLAEVRATEFIERASYNRVWVGGESAGVAGFITRAGTPGDVLAEQVIHPLITAAEAQRMRGGAELANTGRQEHVTLTLQVLPQTGLILPGQWVRHSFPAGSNREIFGIVRSMSLSYEFPTLRQSITLETHPHA